ncbi:MAG: SusC/RagA family TonB-linked outer membrane protein, partial [Flavobacteriaceae bacterium]|nr:SusC/RagA family TonB-linked outer membrane protein [Flavobacteriaceae bacterium]
MNTSKPFGVFLFLVFSTQLAFTQNRTITGTVTSASNDSALFGVNIIVKGTSRGEQTDLNGTYSIDAKIGEVLVFSYIGQTTVEVLIGESDTINVSMTESVGVLDEVIIIAYGEQTKQKLVQSTSIVANRDIKDIPALAPQELLQGQAAGVQVVNSSGVLGSSPVIKIRGAASLTSGGRPLVVVDGVPLDDTNRGFSLGSQPLNPLGDINPNDIESFSILKDASATAIYGSRGANGVILITTKKGRKNQPTRLSLNVSTSWNESTDQLDMMNADQFREYRLITGLAQPGQDPETSFDWPGSVFRTGFSQQVQFNASGGGDQTTFHISGTALNEEGFLIGNTLKRLSGRINLEHEMNDWVKFGINLGVTRNNNDRLFTENSSRSLTSAYLIQPWILPRDENGNFVSTGFAGNVIAAEELDILYAETVRNIGNVFVELTPIKNLKFRSFFGIDRSVYEEFSRAVEVNVSGGFADDLVVQQNRFVFNNTLNYSKTFNATHDLALTAGMSYEETDRRSIYVSGTGFLSDDQINVISASTPGFSYNTTGGSRLVGYFGRANYAFKDKYIAEGSFRRDGSSKFGESNRYGTFYAFGAGWIISKESF